MKRLCLTVGLITAAFSMGLQAQVLDARANIPFDFWLGQQLMPAGAYSIYHMTTGAVLIRGENRKPASAIFLGLQLSRPDQRSDGALEFTRYDNTYFLSKIWNPHSRDGCSVPKTPREKELATHATPPKTTAIVLVSR